MAAGQQAEAHLDAQVSAACCWAIGCWHDIRHGKHVTCIAEAHLDAKVSAAAALQSGGVLWA